MDARPPPARDYAGAARRIAVALATAGALAAAGWWAWQQPFMAHARTLYEIALSQAVAEQMRAGETYLQIETTGFPDGAIRGQLVPQPVRLEDAAEPEEEDE